MIYPRKIIQALKAILQERVITLDYPWKAISRYSQKKAISQEMASICASANVHFAALVEAIGAEVGVFNSFPVSSTDGMSVYWKNNFLPGLDIVSLFAMIKKLRPGKIVEIGSGHSTAVMRTAINHCDLPSKIWCIDPSPRREIKDLADEWIRQPLEEMVNWNVFSELSPGDVIFFDGSHIALANSDVTVFFLEVLPIIPKGVYICIHDIYLPYDYPTEMAQRGYNEQYLLAILLTSTKDRYEVIFPAYYVYLDSNSQTKLNESVWQQITHASLIEKHGGSFWFKVN